MKEQRQGLRTEGAWWRHHPEENGHITRTS
jgi:hypothetical protein